jgi:hypothetical protein
VGHSCNPSTQEAEVGGPRVPGQYELHVNTLSQKNLLKPGTSGS